MKKILTVYYSYSGNTKKIAEKIHDALGGDIAEIETVVPYSGDYDAVVDQGNKEVQKGFKPKIRPLPVNHADYDVIVLGTPVWWYTFAPAVKTFLESNDFSQKTIFPFATNGGWIGHTFKDIAASCKAEEKGVTIKKGLNLRFDGNAMRTPQSELNGWISAIAKEEF